MNKMVVASTTRSFRNDFKNPYKYDPVELAETERVKQEALPVWDRIYDHKKYMEIEGPLKVIFQQDVAITLIVINWSCLLRCRAIP